DSAAFADPLADLRRLAQVVGVLEPAVTDCAWGRLTPWRELLAAPFGAPQLRPALDQARWLRVDSVEPTAGLELVGWFASRLGWELDGADQEGDELAARYRTPAGSCQARVVAAIGSSNLNRVHLEMDTDDGPASVRVEAPPGHLVATVEAPGQPTGRRKVGRSPAPSTGPAGLGQELQLFGRDRVFEDALAGAAALVPA
ncbi:MAG TPA: OpcA/G6PD domain-containing protein, partial [Actinomycetota bacterium]|nr:OpcA/G6PD domain-containing protein [Actinomycetota bacterium]